MEKEEEEESSETGKDKGGGCRCKSSWGEEAELTHKGGRSFISRDKFSHESSASSIYIQRTTKPCSARPQKQGFLGLLS